MTLIQLPHVAAARRQKKIPVVCTPRWEGEGEDGTAERGGPLGILPALHGGPGEGPCPPSPLPSPPVPS